MLNSHGFGTLEKAKKTVDIVEIRRKNGRNALDATTYGIATESVNSSIGNSMQVIAR